MQQALLLSPDRVQNGLKYILLLYSLSFFFDTTNSSCHFIQNCLNPPNNLTVQFSFLIARIPFVMKTALILIAMS